MVHDLSYIWLFNLLHFSTLYSHITLSFFIPLDFLPQLTSVSMLLNNFYCNVCGAAFQLSKSSSSTSTFGYAAADVTTCHFIAFFHFAKKSRKGEKWKFYQFRTVNNKIKSSTPLTSVRHFWTWVVPACVHLWRKRKLKGLFEMLKNEMKSNETT